MTFRNKTIIGIALIQGILLTILVLGGIRWLHDSNEAQLIERADALTRLYASNMKDALLASDIAKLNSITEDSETNPGLKYLRVMDASSLVLASVGNEKLLSKPFMPDTDPSKVTDEIYDTGRDIAEGGTYYGRIELGLSVAEFQALLSEAKMFGVSMAALVMVLVALFSIALGTYLTAQLSSLTEASERISQEGPGFKLPVRGNDELAQVTLAFNKMSESLSTSYRELQENAEKYRAMSKQLELGDALKSAMLSTALDAVVTIDENGIVHDFNKAAEEIFGYTAKEAAGREMATLIVPEAHREAHRQGMKHWSATGEGPILGTRLEITAMHKDGSEFPIELAITPLQTDEQTYFTGFIRDITERKSAENELRLAASAFDSHEAIFITDSNSRIMRVNHAFCNITGYSAEESIGHTPAEIIKSGKHPAKFYAGMWKSLDEKGQWEGEIYNRRKDGEIYPEWLSITAVKDENNSTSHFVAHFIDISERKNFERELKHARELAEQANWAKSQFLANMSHEIRTPLNAVINLNALLLDTQLDKTQKELVQGAYEGGKALTTLVSDILDFSKIEAGKFELERNVFNLHQMVSGVIAIFKKEAELKGLSLHLDISPDVKESVTGDDRRLRQVLVNLIGNAIKFTEKGHVAIRVESESDDLILFVIEDTGIGISDKDKNMLFKEFSQADPSLTRKYGGTGLGLAISQRLVQLMRGSIDCKAQKPHGSMFWFSIPLGPPSETNEADEESVKEKPMNVHVLVAEDSKANQLVVKSLLEKIGCKVELANNGAEAVKQASDTTFDMIFMDVSMPVMDGLEATRKIRGTNMQIPIIATTANVFSEDRNKCLQAGMNDFVAKPVDPLQLKECIMKWSPNSSTLNHSEKITEHQYELLDEDSLIRLESDTSKSMMPQLISIFITEMDERLKSLEAVQRSKDESKIIASAHAIKSSAGTFGALQLQDAARIVEELGREGRLDEAWSGISSIVDIGNKTLEYYRQRFVVTNPQ